VFKHVFALFAVLAFLGGGARSHLEAQQSFTGRLSDNLCGASHQSRAAGDTDRQCLLACIKALEKYVLVDRDGRVVPIANQDAMGLPLYAGRPVRITGELSGDAILVARIEAIPAHLHILHVMTTWRDTPGSRGFLPVAIDEARVALEHARLAAKASRLDDVHLHAGHVLHALDPGVEPKGPGAGYGVKKATAGAVQHLGLAMTADGATGDMALKAAQVLSSLSTVLELIDQAIAAARQTRSSTDPSAGTRLAVDLEGLTRRISDESLQQAVAQMNLILKAEGLLGVPR
jgi:hypothetical protein